MKGEKDLKIVIKAADDFSHVFTKLQFSAEQSGSRIRKALSGHDKGADFAWIKDFETALKRIGSAEKGAGAARDERALYGERLARLKEFNGAATLETKRALDEQARLDEEYSTFTIENTRKRRDFQISAAQTASATIANTLQNIFVATGSKYKAIFELMKAYAIAETLIATYRGATAAFAALAGIPIIGPALATAAAASAVASGLARVEQIRGTHPGGGSISPAGAANPSYSGGSPSAYPVPERLASDSEVRPSQEITINIYNPLSEQNWAKITEDNIIPAINAAGDRNVHVTVRSM